MIYLSEFQHLYNENVLFIEEKTKVIKERMGNSLAVQWLGLGTFTAMGPGSIPGRGTKIPQAMWRSQNKKKKERMDTDQESYAPDSYFILWTNLNDLRKVICPS